MTAKQKLVDIAVDAYHRAMPFMVGHLGFGVALRQRFVSGQRLLIIRRLEIDTILDVGANIGQYALDVRRSGFAGAIHSFEPGSGPFRTLRARAERDDRWFVYNCAVAGSAGSRTLSTWDGKRSVYGSLMSPAANLGASLGPAARETVPTTTLAGWLQENSISADRALLKVDVQGSEREVFLGAGDRLSDFAALEFEAPIRSTYDGEAQITELLSLIDDAGFRVASIETDRFFPERLGADDVDVLAVRNDLLY